MKYVISTILVVVLGMLTYGFYIKSNGDTNGEIIIGIGVLMVAFVLMPLFIYHRYKDKDLSSFRLKNFLEEVKKNDDKNKKD